LRALHAARLALARRPPHREVARTDSSRSPISKLSAIPRYASLMKLPLDRERMRERNLLDDIDEIELAAAQSPEQRFVDALDLSEFALDLYLGNPNASIIDRIEDLREKARLWAAPLAMVK
jgi:hypothetical protein